MSISHDKKPPFIASDMFPFAETNNIKKNEYVKGPPSQVTYHATL